MKRSGRREVVSFSAIARPSESETRCSEFVAAIAATTSPGILTQAAAAGYPSRPVTLIVNCTPSEPSDMLARVVGRQMEKAPGQPS